MVLGLLATFGKKHAGMQQPRLTGTQAGSKEEGAPASCSPAGRIQSSP
jgi:hypothetical protein